MPDVLVRSGNLQNGKGANGVYTTTQWIADDFFGVEVSAFALLGARVGFNVAEFADLLCGCVGWDLLDDDRRGEKSRKPGQRAQKHRGDVWR